VTAETPGQDFNAWLQDVLQPSALAELGVVALCLGLAWLVTRQLQGRMTLRNSIWFGDRVIDGVLFPVLALLATVLARHLLRNQLPLLVLNVAVPVLISLCIIRVGVRVLRVALPTSQIVRVLERSLSWLVWIGLVLWLTELLPIVLAELDAIQWKVGGAQVSVRSLIEGALTAIAVLVLMLWLSAAIEARLLAGAGEAGYVGNTSVRKIAANGTRALLLVVGVLFALSAAGIPLGALSVLGGAVGVGIGFGLQKLAANYVSGFVILAENSLRIGDMVKVDNFEGRITDINTRYTVIRALNGRESIVPNEMLITQRVESLSLSDSRVSVNTTVQVGYETDVEALIPKLIEVVQGIDRVLSDPAPGVTLTGFGANGIDLNIGFWIRDPHNGQGNVASNVNRAILRTLNALGVEIPYPQQVVRDARTPAAAPADSPGTAA
jgi:small-conductance mechanosensitive channel